MNKDSKPYKWQSREQSLGYMVNWAARLFAREMDDALRPFGLMSGQLPVFFALADGEPLPQRELVRLAAVEQSTMAKTLSRMERDSLIDRLSGRDAAFQPAGGPDFPGLMDWLWDVTPPVRHHQHMV